MDSEFCEQFKKESINSKSLQQAFQNLQKWTVNNKFENSFYHENIMEGYLKKDKMDKSVWKSNHVKRYFELNFNTATLTVK